MIFIFQKKYQRRNTVKKLVLTVWLSVIDSCKFVKMLNFRKLVFLSNFQF